MPLVILLAVGLTACVAPAIPPEPIASRSPAPQTRSVVTQPARPADTPAPADDPLALHPDGLARVVAIDGVVAWERAGGRGKPIRALPIDEVTLLGKASRAADGATWWRVPLEPYSAALGWISDRADDGSAALAPVRPDCPDIATRLPTAELPVNPLVRLVCFGSQQLEVAGRLTCEAGIAELSIQGASWIDAQRWCNLDGILRVNGQPVTSTIGPFGGSQQSGPVVVRGHFDDPDAAHCVSTSWGVTLGPNPGPGEPGAILQCRLDFVTTELLTP